MVCDFFKRERFFEKGAEPIAAKAASEVEIVFAGGSSDDADFGEMGSGATIWAACYSEGDGFFFENVDREDSFELGNELGNDAFAFR